MKTKQLIKASQISLLAMALGLTACSSGITGKASYNADGQKEMSSKTQNYILGMRVKIEDIKTTRTNDLLVANIHFRSKWSFTQDVKYRVHWFDEEGIEIEPERAAWKNMILTGKSNKTQKVTAPTPAATNLVVYLRD